MSRGRTLSAFASFLRVLGRGRRLPLSMSTIVVGEIPAM